MNRKQLLQTGGAGLLAVTFGRAVPPAGASTDLVASCVLTPEQEEGPFYVDLERIRNDVKEARTGLPLKLDVHVLDSRTCKPLSNAAVDIWHCDALGVYSGVNGTKTTFLRGVQLTNEHGLATFGTIYPGWYQGRAIHVHLKVHVGGKRSGSTYSGGHVSHTGQIFFPERINALVAKKLPYRRHTIERTTNAVDGVYTAENGSQCVAKLARHGTGYAASIVFGVSPAATPAPRGR